MERRDDRFGDAAETGNQGRFFSEEPDRDPDEEEIEDDPEPSVRGRWVRIVLVGAVLLAGVVVGLPYLRAWWSRPVPPPAPSQAVKSDAPAPPTRSAPVEAPKAAPQSAAVAAPAPRESTAPSAPASGKGEFWVQVGAFANSKNAQRLGDRLTAERYPVTIRPSDARADVVVVRVGAYPDRRQAEAARTELEKKGFTGFVLREKRQ